MSHGVPPGFDDWAKGSNYELRGTLGRGAMGVVLDGFDRVIKRRIAVKVVRKPSTDDLEAMEALARFRREPAMAGPFSHPGIVSIHDYGENAQFAWMVMEMVGGGTLEGFLKDGARMPLPAAAAFMVRLLGALSYAHTRGIVHRDVKPANVMLTEDGHPKLVDFGVARTDDSDLTVHGTMMGTPSYMAPEQFRGEPADARADVWAAGVILYQLLTGDKPFSGPPEVLLHKVLNTEPKLPSELSVAVPAAMDAVVMRALAKRRDDRWPDADTFADAIALAAKPVVTPPIPSEGRATDPDAKRREPASDRSPPSGEMPGRRPRWVLPAVGLGLLAAGGLAAFLILPVTPPQRQPPPRPDLRAVADAALAAAPCGLLANRAEETTLDIEGVLPRAEAERLRAELAARDLPDGTARLSLGLFEGPFCGLLDALRPALGPPREAPELSLAGSMPLRKGDMLRFSVRMPDWANHLHVVIATSDGNLLRLEPGAPQQPGAQVRLGEPRPGFPGWEVDEPFGTDLLIAVVSEGPFPGGSGPVEQSQAEYAESFAQALRAARAAGRRVALRPVVVETTRE